MATGILDNIKEAVQASLNVSQMKTLTTPIIVDETEYSTVETALNAINSKSVDVDDELSAVSENPIQNKVITEEINKKLTVVDNMPTASAEFVGKQNLYVGNTTDYLNKGGIYECRSDGSDGYEWVLISTADVDLSKYKKIFTGTRAEWDALTAAEKKEYDICNLTDDIAGGELVVSDEVIAGDLNPVTSNAVASYIPNITRALVSWPTESNQIAWGSHKGVIIQTGNEVGTVVTNQVLVMRNFPNAYVGQLFYPAQSNNILTAAVTKTSEGFYLTSKPTDWTNSTIILYWID